MRYFTIACLICVLSACANRAPTDDDERAALIAECQLIAEDDERLACLERAMLEENAAEPPQQGGPVQQ